VLDFFVAAGRLLGQPKSVSEIYGTLYFSERPLCMAENIERLQLSKGSASQGLRLLRDMGAVRVVQLAEDRRDFYQAETSLKKIVSGYVQNAIEPHLAHGHERLQRLDQLARASNQISDFHQSRLEQLARWQRKAARALPVIRTVFK